MLKIGCCGFAKARATYYDRFGVVEVQQTFYQPPRPATLARWRREAPAGLEFSLKAWQPITHPSTSPTWRRLKERLDRPEEAGYFRRSDVVDKAWERTREAAGLLRANVVVFQCPASFTPTGEHIENLHHFFSDLSTEAACDSSGSRAVHGRRHWLPICAAISISSTASIRLYSGR
jgi:uncharacterized protein YecE (DUF72 family)